MDTTELAPNTRESIASALPTQAEQDGARYDGASFTNSVAQNQQSYDSRENQRQLFDNQENVIQNDQNPINTSSQDGINTQNKEKDPSSDKQIEDQSTMRSRVLSSIYSNKYPKKIIKNTNHLWQYLVEQKQEYLEEGPLKSFIDYILPPPGEKGMADHACKLTYMGNFIGSILEFASAFKIFPLPQKSIDLIESINTWITRIGFMPYGLDGAVSNLRKKGFYGALGFALEPICALAGNLKDIYFLRGLSTGIESIPVAVEKVSGTIFDNFMDGINKITKSIGHILKDSIQNPKILFSKNQQGHIATLSCLTGILSSSIYYLTGRKFEKVLGTARDISAIIFDSTLCFSKVFEDQLAGVLFIVEALIDGFARFFPSKFRYPTNQLAHGIGRFGLELYKDKHRRDMIKDKQVGLAV